MRTFDVTGLKAKIIQPSTNLITWCNSTKPFACCNASLYTGVSTTTRPTVPCGTIIENHQMVHNDGNGYGVGISTDILEFGKPWDTNWKDYLTGYNSPVQNGKYVEPNFVDNYVFPNKLARTGIGRKQGKTYIVTDDNVTLQQFAQNAIAQGFDTLVNLDGGASRHVYYDGKFIYQSSRIPYNAIAWYKEGSTTTNSSSNEKSDTVKKYIDVSEHQGVIDFNKLKGNVDGVIIRAGYGRGTIDSRFIRNVTECNRLGIPCGAYWFSYAYNATMAQNEAKALVNAVSKYKMELPLAFDYEYDSVTYGQKQGVTITSTLVKNMTNAFCQEVEKQGYYCMLYANPDFINRYFGNLTDRYDLWLAQWPSKVDVNNPPRSCGIWQWGTSIVPGISGAVDTNAAYKDYAVLIRNSGANHLTSTPSTPSTPSIPSTPSTPSTPNAPSYTEAMKWAKDNGINDGLNATSSVTKADVTQMIYNLYNKYIKR